MKRVLIIAVFASVFVLAFDSCEYDNKEDLYPKTNCDISSVKFSSTIMPIMVQSCAISNCHDATTVAGGLNLNSYQDVKISADNGNLLNRLKGIGGSQMPLDGNPLPNCEISKIESWVADGALNN